METVSQDIHCRVEALKQVKGLAHDGNNPDLVEEQLNQEEALKFALREKIQTRLSIRVHAHFLQFCTWLNGREGIGSTEEQLLWERNLLCVQTKVKSEIEEALREVDDIERAQT